MQRRRALGTQLLSVLEYDDAQGRIQLQIRLTHHRAQRETELDKLAESLYGGLAAVIADGLERSELSFDPVRIRRPRRQRHGSSKQQTDGFGLHLHPDYYLSPGGRGKVGKYWKTTAIWVVDNQVGSLDQQT